MPRPHTVDYVRLGGRIVNSSEHYHPVCPKSTKMRLGIARIQCGLYFNRKFGEHPRPPLNERSQLNDVMVRRGEACLALAGVAHPQMADYQAGAASGAPTALTGVAYPCIRRPPTGRGMPRPMRIKLRGD